MRTFREILADLDRFEPEPGDEADWSALTELVHELFEQPVTVEAVEPLLRVVDRFKHRHAFSAWWPIVNGIEAIRGFELALVASYQLAPSPTALTLLLRVLGRGVLVIDGIDLATFAAAALADT